MAIPDSSLLYPRKNDKATIYLKNAVERDSILVGDFTIYNDFCNDPRDFEKNNVLYHYPVNGDKLIIGRYCSIACGAKFIMTSGNHALHSLSTYAFPIFYDEWGLDPAHVKDAWDNRGGIEVGNDVWIGYDSVIMSGVKIGDGAVIASRAVVTKDVPPFAIAGGIPAKIIRKRFSDEVNAKLSELRWWDWPVEKVRENIPHIQSGNISELLKA